MPGKPKILIVYQYDALDRLISYGQPDAHARKLFHCDNRLASAIAADERLSIMQQGEQILAQQHQLLGGTISTLLAADLQHSVLGALKADGRATFSYSPHGHRIHESILISVLGFNGQRPDPVTGHYLLGNGYRSFNPVLMRFNSPDQLSPFGMGGLNPYAYCLGDPVNRNDATGRVSSMITAAASTLSTSFGYKVKNIHGLENLSPGIGMFEDVYKGAPRVTFMGHGSGLPGEYLLAAGEGVFVDASGLVALAKKNKVNMERYDNVRLLVCHSAEPGVGVNGVPSASFGQQLSDIVQLPVKAFHGEVGGKATRVPIVGVNAGSEYVDYFGVFKSPATLAKFGGKDPYRPVKIQPQTISESNQDIRI